jgi:hypothetical protein
MVARFEHGFVLSLTSPPALPAGSQLPKPIRVDNGVPVYRFKKQIIRCGNFNTADGEPFTVDRQALAHWANTFKIMAANKVPVPVPADHAKVDGDGNRGFVVDMQPEGDALVATIDLVGTDAPKLAASNDVSIFAEPQWTDGEGNTYQWPIRHVALTPDPRIPGLKGFVAISAANQRTKNVPLLKLDGVQTTMALPMPGEGAQLPQASTGSTAGDIKTAPKHGSTKALKDSIKSHFLGKAHAIMASDELPHDGKLEQIDALLQQLEAIIEQFEEEEKAEPGEGAAGPIVAEGGEEGAAMCNAGKAAMSNRRGVAAQPETNPMLLKLANKSREQDIENLFRDGFITPKQRDALRAKWCGEKVKLTLSNEKVEDFDAEMALLREGFKVSGERTGAQVLTLANPYIDKEAQAAEKAEADLCKPSSQRATAKK